MLADSYIVPECVVRPGTLGGLISLYEGNFIKLAALLGDKARSTGQFVSRCRADCDLHLSIDDGSRFTRLLRLTYVFDEASGAVADPDMVLRIFFDARVAEVVSWAGSHRHGFLETLGVRYGRELDRRWVRPDCGSPSTGIRHARVASG